MNKKIPIPKEGLFPYKDPKDGAPLRSKSEFDQELKRKGLRQTGTPHPTWQMILGTPQTSR